MLCEYRDIIGKVGQGVHSYRFLNIAIVDVIVTIMLAFGIHKMLGSPFLITLFIVFLLGILSHRIFCVRTTIDKLLFG
jgi:hypothetical protein